MHLPAECFVEYQLRAQQLASSRFIATAAYGDGGPWYIPIKEAYPQGGYEVDIAHYFYRSFRPRAGSLEMLADRACEVIASL